MEFIGNLRKMRTELHNEVHYSLPIFENINPLSFVDLNGLIGKTLSISYNGIINCVVTGKRIKKAYGEGMSYDAFMSSPMAVESILRPELSRIHEGVALRDFDWEMKNHMQPHVVYLSKTAGIKVGVTRVTQIPYRWIDQGAVEALVIAETPYRQAAGNIEIKLKNYISDKTNWRKMLQNNLSEESLEDVRDELFRYLDEESLKLSTKENLVFKINFPVLKYPEKVNSISLDKVSFFEEKLVGIKGQYLIFENNLVFNVRKHSGYQIKLCF
tara:strand:+ start:3797 stop:4609 length:813 start_codon:yes stop_codon:yes gene_type:complete